MYPELLRLLTCDDLEPGEPEELTRQILAAPDDPDYAWAQGDPAIAMACELQDILGEFAATSDKIDEAHEQIQDMFDDDFPGFPFELFDGAHRIDGKVYFRSLNEELAQRAAEDGGYEIIEFDTGADDRLTLIVVYRKDVDRILELASALGLRMSAPARDDQAASG